jgi:2-methylisocitrate lyase-like PEP mutase family enzyme
VGKPLNVVMSAADPAITQAQLAEAGVKRISVGGALSRLALAAFLKGAREMKDAGGFTWVRETVPQRSETVFRATPRRAGARISPTASRRRRRAGVREIGSLEGARHAAA